MAFEDEFEIVPRENVALVKKRSRAAVEPVEDMQVDGAGEAITENENETTTTAAGASSNPLCARCADDEAEGDVRAPRGRR